MGLSPALQMVARCGRSAGGVRCGSCLLSLWGRGCPEGLELSISASRVGGHGRLRLRSGGVSHGACLGERAGGLEPCTLEDK